MPELESAAIRLILVDDHAMFREGIGVLLAREADFEITGKFATAADALNSLSESQPSVILLDFDLGTERALDFVRDARQAGFAGRILIVTAGVSEQEAVLLIRAGVAGIVHKHSLPEILCSAIRQVAGGEVFLEKSYLKPLFHSVEHGEDAEPKLGERDKAILRFVFQGLANKEIGARLALSEGAVKACLRQLFRKLGVQTRAQLVKVALEQYRDQL